MDQIKIGAFLKVLRTEKNLTQEQLAEQLGVSGQYPDGKPGIICPTSVCWLKSPSSTR